ncbi:MAG: PAS domain-containing sensor histidine kinase [Deferrisomatales bacterium]
MRSRKPTLWRSLAVYAALPVLGVALVSGAGLYWLVNRSVERFALEQLQRETEVYARDAYTLCEQGYDTVLRTGSLGDPRREALARGRTLGALEDFLRQRGLAGRVVGPAAGEPLLRLGAPGVAGVGGEVGPGSATVLDGGGRRYLAARFTYEPWEWEVTLLHDLAQYTALLGEVRGNYLGAGLWALATGLLLSLLIGVLLRGPVRAILGPLAAGRRPSYRGIAEFEHLSDTVGRIVESERDKAYHLAEAQRIAHLGHWRWNVVDDVVEWSDELQRVCGVEGAAPGTLAQVFWAIVHPEDAPRVRAAFAAALRGSAAFDLELRVLRPDGEVRVVDARAEVTRGPGGRILTMAGTAHDVTERRAAEAALKAGEARFRALAEHSQAGIWQLGPDEETLYANPAMCRLLEVEDPDEVRRFPLDSFFSPASAARIAAETPARRRGESATYEVELIGRRGTRRATMLSAAPLLGEDGGFRGTMGTFVDITDLRLLEAERRNLEDQVRQKQKLESLGVLAGGIAHDLNNTLAPIIGFAELAADDTPEGSPNRERLGRVLSAAERARDLVQQILVFARQSKEGVRPVHLAAEVRETLALVRASLPATIRLESELEDEGAWIQATPTAIHQVLTNLCTNAGHAMPRGGRLRVAQAPVRVDDGADAELAAGEYLCLTVEDTGDGIPPEVLPRIFDPFFTTKGVGEGTGMGLSVVHGIARDLGGAVRVESAPGQGARFRVWLPRTAEGAEDPRSADATAPEPAGRRLLLVDDEPLLREFWVEALERKGYRAEAVGCAEDALARLRRAPEEFDLVLTDQTMPGLTGADLLAEITALRPDLPVILCTGFSAGLTPEKARALGARALLQKPFGARDLLAAVRKALGDPRLPLAAGDL